MLEHIQYKECGLAFGLQTHFEGHKSEKAAAVLEEEKFYETKIVEETETVDSKSDTYARVGFWRDEVCYKQLIIQRPFFFTKQI